MVNNLPKIWSEKSSFHRSQTRVNQNLEAYFQKAPFRRSLASCLPYNQRDQHPECSLATDRPLLSLFQGPTSGGLSESHFLVLCFQPILSNDSIPFIDGCKSHTCGKELTTWGLRFKPEGRPLLNGRLFPAGRACNTEEIKIISYPILWTMMYNSVSHFG